MKSSCARWRRAHPGVLNDLPTAVVLPFQNHYVASFGVDFSPGGDSRESFLEVPAVVSQIAGSFKVLAVEREVTIEGGHNILEQGAESGGSGDPIAVGLKEDGVRRIKLQNGFELFGAKVLHPRFADFGDGCDS